VMHDQVTSFFPEQVFVFAADGRLGSKAGAENADRDRNRHTPLPVRGI
jgi:hypothetical protein